MDGRSRAPTDGFMAYLGEQIRVMPDTEVDTITAVIHRMSLATRNVADFSGCGVTICNPFDPAPTPA